MGLHRSRGVIRLEQFGKPRDVVGVLGAIALSDEGAEGGTTLRRGMPLRIGRKTLLLGSGDFLAESAQEFERGFEIVRVA